MSNNVDPWELPEQAPASAPAPEPASSKNSGSNRGVMWTLLVLLIVMIVAMGAAFAYLFLGNKEGNEAEGPSASAPKKTVTFTATATETAAAAKKDKDRCAPSMFSDSKATNADSRIGEVVVDYCDGQWAKWGIYGTGGSNVERWSGSGWSAYKAHGKAWSSGYACYDLDLAKRDGMPAELREKVLKCESTSEATKPKKSSTSSSAEATETSSESASAEPSGGTGSCDASAFPDRRGDLVVLECDGEWAMVGPANTGALSLMKWDGGEWTRVEPDGEYSSGMSGGCFTSSYIDELGAPRNVVSKMKCDG